MVKSTFPLSPLRHQQEGAGLSDVTRLQEVGVETWHKDEEVAVVKQEEVVVHERIELVVLHVSTWQGKAH